MGRQFIFITPQGMNNADSQTDIKIIRYVLLGPSGTVRILIIVDCKIRSETRGH